jgi:hypothetical protein
MYSICALKYLNRLLAGSRIHKNDLLLSTYITLQYINCKITATPNNSSQNLQKEMYRLCNAYINPISELTTNLVGDHSLKIKN